MKKLLMVVIILISTVNLINCENNNYNYFNLTKVMTFPNGVSNQVSYINLPNVDLWGWIEVTITGGWNWQANSGKLTKRFAFMYNAPGGTCTQKVEVPTAFGDLANQWNIGDYDIINHRIPIYHLASTGNNITIQIEGTLEHVNSVNSIKTNLSISEPAIVLNSTQRQYMNIMQERLGIGIIDPKNTLDVNGTIHAKQVLVDITGWSDFVFEKSYILPKLSEVNEFVQTNGHLPNIPSESEVKENGVNVAEMQAKLLQKIEELTLYVIQQDQKIEQLQKQLGNK